MPFHDNRREWPAPYLDFFGASNGMEAWIVDGHFIRGRCHTEPIDIDFTEGGNDMRYGELAVVGRKYIPSGEVWLDVSNMGEVYLILLHELTERNKMKLLKQEHPEWSNDRIYDVAHDYANLKEGMARKDKATWLVELLAEQGWTEPIK